MMRETRWASRGSTRRLAEVDSGGRVGDEGPDEGGAATDPISAHPATARPTSGIIAHRLTPPIIVLPLRRAPAAPGSTRAAAEPGRLRCRLSARDLRAHTDRRASTR